MDDEYNRAHLQAFKYNSAGSRRRQVAFTNVLLHGWNGNGHKEARNLEWPAV